MEKILNLKIIFHIAKRYPWIWPRTYAFLRLLLYRRRFNKVLNEIPKDARRFVDIGSGYGLTAHVMSEMFSDRPVIGVDTSSLRIQGAQASVQSGQRLSFVLQDAKQFQFESGDAIVMIDALHHFPYSEHVQFLHAIAERVGSSGYLLLAEIETEPKWKYWITYLVDTVLYPRSVRAQFYSRSNMRKMLLQAGWKINREQSTAMNNIFSTVLYVCTPRAT